MAVQFEHFLMTRFNLATPGREEKIRNSPRWLDYRFDLFERFCLPSVAGQTLGSFRWIVYFDAETPEPYRARIETLSRDGVFTPYFTPLFQSEGWSRSIAETFAPTAALIATTRLDSDDAIASDFVERLHRAILENGGAQGSYNFDHGIVRHRAAIYLLRHQRNAFFTYLDSNAPTLRTAPSIRHMEIDKHGPVVQIGGAPAWMQIIHESNVSNKVRGRRLSDVDIADRFAGEAGVGLAPVGAARVMVENATLGVFRHMRDAFLHARH